MKIEFERTGGFAGTRLTTAVDTADLPPDEARRLSKLFKESRFFELPLNLTAHSPGPDRFQYRVRVELSNRTHTVEASDESVPARLRPLIDWLVHTARRR